MTRLESRSRHGRLAGVREAVWRAGVKAALQRVRIERGLNLTIARWGGGAPPQGFWESITPDVLEEPLDGESEKAKA
jgi:hypothetical protein